MSSIIIRGLTSSYKLRSDFRLFHDMAQQQSKSVILLDPWKELVRVWSNGVNRQINCQGQNGAYFRYQRIRINMSGIFWSFSRLIVFHMTEKNPEGVIFPDQMITTY